MPLNELTSGDGSSVVFIIPLSLPLLLSVVVSAHRLHGVDDVQKGESVETGIRQAEDAGPTRGPSSGYMHLISYPIKPSV